MAVVAQPLSTTSMSRILTSLSAAPRADSTEDHDFRDTPSPPYTVFAVLGNRCDFRNSWCKLAFLEFDELGSPHHPRIKPCWSGAGGWGKFKRGGFIKALFTKI